MKGESNKIIGLLVVIIIGLTFSTIWLSTKKDQAIPESTDPNEEKLQLLEIKTQSHRKVNDIFGWIAPNKTLEVTMEVSGKIDDDNISLNKGTIFNKNDVLIKVDRNQVLYELLALRSNFKSYLIKNLDKISAHFPDEIKKWESFTNSISRTAQLPELPVMTREEEELITELEIFSLYYNIKIVEQKAQKYIFVAPFNGLIIDSKVRAGSFIKQNTKLLTIAERNSSIIRSYLPLSLANDYQSSNIDFTVAYKGQIIGTAKYLTTKSIKTDSALVEFTFTTSLQEAKYINKIIELIPSEKTTGNWVPSSIVSADSLITIFKDNQFLILPVEVLESTKDSVKLNGLPNHFFAVIKEKR